MSGPHMVGGIWPFGRPDDLGADGIGPWEFIARCIVVGSDVLRDAGLWREEHNYLGQGDVEALEAQVEKGSKEDVALALWTLAQSTRPLLRWASQCDHRAEGSAEANALSLAGAFANLGLMWQVMVSLAPKGIAEMAVSGAAERVRLKAASARAAEASRRNDWHDDARRLWADNPGWTVNRVAGVIAASHSTQSLAVDKRSVMRSIAPLIPATSPSYKGG